MLLADSDACEEGCLTAVVAAVVAGKYLGLQDAVPTFAPGRDPILVVTKARQIYVVEFSGRLGLAMECDLMQPRFSHRGPILDFVFDFVSFYLLLEMCWRPLT